MFVLPQVVLGDKYGPYLLPSRIPVEEFHAFFDFVEDFSQKETELIKEQINQITSARAERERQRHNAESVLTDNTDDTGDKRSSKRDGSGMSAQKLKRHNADIAKAEAQTIKSLHEQEAALPNPEILKEWYSLDKNCVPPVYKLDNVRYRIISCANLIFIFCISSNIFIWICLAIFPQMSTNTTLYFTSLLYNCRDRISEI